MNIREILKENCSKEEIATFVEHVIPQLTLEEKTGIMTGQAYRTMYQSTIGRHYNKDPYETKAVNRLGIPNMRFMDGPRGVVGDNATCFPVAMARGASFDVELEEKVGDIIGKEVRAIGANYFGGVCINVPRHPAWGRCQEVYGEDPYLLGEMGAALVRGVQKHNVMACIKHYACNSIENTRNKVNVSIDARTLREVYIPHFKRCIDQGAASVMGAYNSVENRRCCESKLLLNDILRDEMGFKGFVISDFIMGISNTVNAVNAGLDIEMPMPLKYGRKLANAVKSGKIKEQAINQSVSRVLNTIIYFETRSEKQEYDESLLGCKEHTDFALEVAEKSVVLIKNEDVLPFDKKKIKRIALIGDLASTKNIGDLGSSSVHPSFVVSPEQGIREFFNNIEINKAKTKEIEKSKVIASQADAVVIVVGNRARDEGENMFFIGGGDRDSLFLCNDEARLIRETAVTNKNTVVVVIGSNAILMNDWAAYAPSILLPFYGGVHGGTAIAKILFGEVNPSGKLPYSIARNTNDYPYFNSRATQITYGYYHGYTLLDKLNKTPAFPFGFGLSYTTFLVSDAKLIESDGEKACFSVKVKNTGRCKGQETIQLYIGTKNSKVDRPIKVLRSFKKVSLDVNEEKEVILSVKKSDMTYYDAENKDYVTEDISYIAYIGTSSQDKDLKVIEFCF